MNTKFNWQSFISLGLLFSFLIMLVSGLVLYIAPEGSLSRWMAWDVFNLTKEQWEQQHTIFAYVFILFSIFHVFKINWTYLISYFILKRFTISSLKEIGVAVIIVMMVFLGTQYQWLPFKTILQLGDEISNGYSENVEIPDFPDSEKLSLHDFAGKVFNISYVKLTEKFCNYNFEKVDKNTSVIDFCILNDISPAEFYRVLKHELSPEDNENSYK